MQFKGKNFQKQKLKIALMYERIRNQRADFLHKLSTQLANQYDYICIEDINLANTARTLKLAKNCLDNGFGMFREFLQYKMEDRGKQLIKIDKWFPSSKTCHCCGSINKNLTLNDRVWVCPSCGETIYRDINAALNIRDAGISLV